MLYGATPCRPMAPQLRLGPVPKSRRAPTCRSQNGEIVRFQKASTLPSERPPTRSPSLLIHSLSRSRPTQNWPSHCRPVRRSRS
ncbi:Uncharacterised protein [Bordetella pertussis]|nr:Uncharacterised protein [Bordetella pertussis]